MLMKEIKDLNMERHPVFMDWKTQHRKDVNSPWIDIQVYNNSSQNTSNIFSSDKQDYSQIYMESQRN